VGDQEATTIGGESQPVRAIGDPNSGEGGQVNSVEEAHPVRAQFGHGDEMTVGRAVSTRVNELESGLTTSRVAPSAVMAMAELDRLGRVSDRLKARTRTGAAGTAPAWVNRMSANSRIPKPTVGL